MSKYHSGEKSTECDERGNIRCAKECTTESPTCTTTNYGNKRKIVYQATEGPNRPVYKYALDLISMVCNNSYSYQTDDPVRCAQRDECVNHRYHYQQVHRFLDKPLFERKPDEEPDKERLMRLQVSNTRFVIHGFLSVKVEDDYFVQGRVLHSPHRLALFHCIGFASNI
eukprot:jgi/Psemu1/314416/fgenesh1_kg.1512_\